MKTLIIGIFLSFTANANQCANLEEIADSFKKDLKAELSNTVFPEDKAGQEVLRTDFGNKINYLKSLKHQVDVCYEDFQLDEVYDCSFSSELIKSYGPGELVTTYTRAVSANGDCFTDLYLGHTTTRNGEGKVILKQQSGLYEINTLHECKGDYTNEEYSFRKFILSNSNFFVMDQYVIYRTDVKVLGKKYMSSNPLHVNFGAGEIAFHYGDAEMVISTKTGAVTRTNFLTMDEVTDGKCETNFSKENNSIYPRTNIDEEAWGFKLKYIAY